MITDPGIRTELHADVGVLEIVLDRPKGNILDAAMVAALRSVLPTHAVQPEVRALLLCGAGRHFSFGASVEEHRLEEVAGMLRGFHGLFRDLIRVRKPLLAAVQGQCLGGGLELAAFCQRVFAAPDAKLGQPEIQLGVFAPVGSLVLPLRIGQAHADDLLLSGRSVEANEALRMGLVDELAEDPRTAALAWAGAHLHPKSTASLAFAVEAARFAYERTFLEQIDMLEVLYLDRLMACHDAREGIEAFLARRTPEWSHS